MANTRLEDLKTLSAAAQLTTINEMIHLTDKLVEYLEGKGWTLKQIAQLREEICDVVLRKLQYE